MTRNGARLWLPIVLMEAALTPVPVHALTAEVRDHLGSPTLFVDGQRMSPLMFFGHPGEVPYQEEARMAARAGIRVFSYVTYPHWPGPGQSYDFTRADAQADAALRANPDRQTEPQSSASFSMAAFSG